jgi:hypothetical protein
LVEAVLPRNVVGADGKMDLRVPLSIAYAIESDPLCREKAYFTIF